jgi:hypothetical protein
MNIYHWIPTQAKRQDKSHHKVSTEQHLTLKLKQGYDGGHLHQHLKHTLQPAPSSMPLPEAELSKMQEQIRLEANPYLLTL